MATPRPSARPRARTQAERRAETRSALLDATIESLVAYGYAGTTTGRIAELAGVSRGAQTPYFRSRADLVGAAVAHLAELRIQAFHDRMAGRTVSVEEGLDAFWAECQGPLYDAVLELWIASRTDPELRKVMLEIERTVGASITEEAAIALGPVADREGFADDMIFTMATIRGLAMLRISHGVSSKALAAQWKKARARLVEILG